MREINNTGKGPDLSLKGLIDIQEWQKVQNNFSAVMGVSIRIVDSQGNLITKPSGEQKLCSSLLRGNSKKDRLCGSCLPTFLGGQGVVDKNLNYNCWAGVCNFVTPLRLNSNDTLGYALVGPVILVMRKQKEEYRQIAEELNLDLEDLWSALLEIKVISFHGMSSLVELIQDVDEYMLNLNYKMTIREKEVIMPQVLSKLNRILDVLLDVASEAIGADIGSIMFLDEERQNLTIRASRGIPEEIVKRAKVRLGEGISGIAAKEEKSFLIDNNIKDNRIKSYLKRPYIGSSMVVPIKVENRVEGIMNLGALKTSAVRFNEDNLQLVSKIIGLITMAMSPLR